MKPLRSMTGSRTVDVHIGPYEHTNDIRVNLWLLHDVPFASWYYTKPGMHRYPPESSLCLLYRNPHYRFCSSFSLLCFGIPSWSHLCLARRRSMPSHQEGPKNVSPSLEEQIPFSSYPSTCQTFQLTCKLSLWLPCYSWRLSNPKTHHTVRSDHDTLMV